MEGGDSPRVVLMVAGGKPFPLRCGGCARVTCHVCQTTTEEQAGGASIMRVSLDCASCGGRLEPVRAPAPAAEKTPLGDEEKRQLKRAYKDQQREEARARGLPPALKELFEAEDRERPHEVPRGCLGFLGFVVGGIVGYNLDPESSWLYPLGGAVAGAVAGYLLALFNGRIRRGVDPRS